MCLLNAAKLMKLFNNLNSKLNLIHIIFKIRYFRKANEELTPYFEAICRKNRTFTGEILSG